MKKKKDKINRGKIYSFRMNDEESSDLDNTIYKTGKSQSEVIREAIKMYNNFIKAK